MPPGTLPIYVTDTHALIWLMNEPERLGVRAQAAFDAVDRGKALLIVPAIVVAEIIFTAARGRVTIDVSKTMAYLTQHPAIELVDLSIAVVLTMRTATVIPEMHDRLIACEAFLRKATLITVDRSIVTSRFVPTVW
jgi:PIN domain nuclease of toxin-antitoxin system